MYSLRKFATRTGSIGRPLTSPFATFGQNRIAFRHGATSMIAGAPGSFKSVLALNMVTRWSVAGHSILYFSADSDEFTVAKRVAGILTGDSSELAEYNMINGRAARYEHALADLGKVHFVYEQMYMERIAERVKSWEAVYGAYPDVIFIDVLMSYADSAGEWESMREMTKQLDALARETRAHVCILHHVSESVSRDKPAPSAAIQGKVSQIPRLVLTVAAIDLALFVTCVKNTNGPQDPMSNGPYMQFLVKPSMAIEDVSYVVSAQ